MSTPPDADALRASADNPAAMPQVVDHVALARLYGEPLFALPQDLYIPPDALEVFLEAFEEPLDLLLYLIVRIGMQPFRQAAKLLSTMPGVSDISAHVIVSEIGIDMSRFQTPGHLLSWACMCPRNDQSACKRRSTRLRRGGK